MIQLQDIMAPSLIREILLVLTVILSLTVLLLFGVLIVHKLSTEKRERGKRQHKERYIGLISRYLTGSNARVTPPRRALEWEALTEVCIDMLSSVSGEMSEKIKRLVKEMSVVEYYKKVARSSSWVKRFFAVEKLSYLRCDELKGYFLGVVERDDRKEVKAKAVWALSLIADEEIMAKVAQVLSGAPSFSSKFNEYIYTNIIHSLRRRGRLDSVLSFVKNIKDDERTPVLLKRDVIEACGSSGLHEAAEVIIDFFSLAENPEMKIACIRALGRLRTPEACHVIMAGFGSEDWRIRAVSAQAASLCQEAAIPCLQRLLYDPVYYVRINASRTLAGLGEMGRHTLEGEVNSPDRFVRDTVRYILGKLVSYV